MVNTLLVLCKAHSKTNLTLNANENLIEQSVAAAVLNKMISESDYEIDIRPVPPSRANAQNLNLTTDGEIARITSYSESNPTLTRIDPPYYHLTSEVFCLKSNKKKFQNTDEIRNYKIAAIRGVAHSDRQLVGHKKIQYTSSAEQMFELLNIGRVDLVLDTGLNGKKILLKKHFQNIKPCGLLAHYDLHLYLNAKSKIHKDFFSKLFTNYKKDKKLEKIWIEMEQSELLKYQQTFSMAQL